MEKTKKRKESDLRAEADRLLSSIPEPTEGELLAAAFKDGWPAFWWRDRRRKDKTRLSLHCCKCGSVMDADERDGEPVRCPRCGARISVRKRAEGIYLSDDFDDRVNLAEFVSAGGWQFVRWYNCKTVGSARSGKAVRTAALVWVYCWPPEGAMMFKRRATVWAAYTWDMRRDGPLSWRPFEGRFCFDWRPFGKPSVSDRFRWFRPNFRVASALVDYMSALCGPHSAMLETLYERGQWLLLGAFLSGGRRPEDYAAALKIAMRNRWQVGREWLDDIDEAASFGRDVRTSAEWLEPRRLSAWIRRNYEDLERRRTEDGERRNLPAALRYEARYEREHATELPSHVRVGGYSIRPLRSVREFYEEGRKMRHCVFACRYYKKALSVILTVRMGGKRVATCELSKPQRKILQLYGPCDAEPENKKAVEAAVVAAMPYIFEGRKACING